jgi:hypothetical protein
MYKLTVAVAHTFFVGDEQWLVHNCGGEATKLFDSLTDLETRTTSNVLELGQEFVGPNAVSPSSGIFVSQKPVQGTDVHAMFRITDSDIKGGHWPSKPHANFQLVRKSTKSNGGASYSNIPGKNKHILFSD